MATLKFRLAALERRVHSGSGACSDCGGLGPWCMTVELAGVLVRPPAACPRCGVIAQAERLSRVIIAGPDDGTPPVDPV